MKEFEAVEADLKEAPDLQDNQLNEIQKPVIEAPESPKAIINTLERPKPKKEAKIADTSSSSEDVSKMSHISEKPEEEDISSSMASLPQNTLKF